MAPDILGETTVCVAARSRAPFASAMCVTRPSGARITDSIYLYGEYDYAYSDKIRIPWAVDAGVMGMVKILIAGEA